MSGYPTFYHGTKGKFTPAHAEVILRALHKDPEKVKIGGDSEVCRAFQVAAATMVLSEQGQVLREILKPHDWLKRNSEVQKRNYELWATGERLGVSTLFNSLIREIVKLIKPPSW